MKLLLGGLGIALLLLVLRDAFETVILPRRVQRKFRLTSLFYRTSWSVWRGVAFQAPRSFRESLLGWYGPFSLLVLLALWALCIILAFGMLHWAAGSAVVMQGTTPGFLADWYLSGTTFFTLGLGDVVPQSALARVLTVGEAGLGFAFLAVIIGYLPVIYQAFSRREIAISMLDARAGSPPAAGELLIRYQGDVEQEDLTHLLVEWERWSAEVLESHISYPVLAYFRSQHGNQSWLAALTTVLDTSALVQVGFDGWCLRQARLTFAMARHAIVDLAQQLNVVQPESLERLDDAEYHELLRRLGAAGMRFAAPNARSRLAELRALYEPYAVALSRRLALALPTWNRQSSRHDNWQGAPWKTAIQDAEHFEPPAG